MSDRKTCQICERQIKTPGGRLAHHGYQRPHGWYSQTASCAGALELPYEEGYSVLERYIRDLKNYYSRTVTRLQDTRDGTADVFERVYSRKNRRWENAKVDPSDRSWPRHQRAQEWQLTQQLKGLNAEIEKQTERLHTNPLFRAAAGWPTN